MSFAANKAAKPSAPVPKITNVESGVGFSTLRTEPAPVIMPHPRGPRNLRGASGRTLITFRAGEIECVANDDWPKNEALRGSPRALGMVAEPSPRLPSKLGSDWDKHAP